MLVTWGQAQLLQLLLDCLTDLSSAVPYQFISLESPVPAPESGSFSEDRYTVVELVAMLLSEARAITEKYADQTVKDAVIAVPPYFNQAERRAMADAAKVAGLNLLQVPARFNLLHPSRRRPPCRYKPRWQVRCVES